MESVDLTNSAALALIGVIVGARLLSLLTALPLVVKYWAVLKNDLHLLYEVTSNGLVFYGGLFGAIFVLHRYTSKYSIDKKLFFDFCAPLIPLFHAFGRIGCFLTGCCHGRECDTLGIAFRDSLSAPNGIPFFPIQLVCSLCNLLLCAAVAAYEKKRHAEGKALRFYLIIYAVGRFVIEFFRGDEVRGFLLGLSTSQWISVGILLFYGVSALTSALRKKRETAI